MKRVFLSSLLLLILSAGSYAQQIPPVPVDAGCTGPAFQYGITEKIREEKGGTYEVGVHQEAKKLPKKGFTLQFQLLFPWVTILSKITVS